MLGGADLDATLGAEFAQAVGREIVVEPGLATAALEPVAKRLYRMRSAKGGDEIDEVSGRRGVKADAQGRQDRQFVRLKDPRAALCLGENQLALALHLRAELDEIAAAHDRVEQEIKCEP